MRMHGIIYGSLRNRLLEWNNYYYVIVITLFVKGLFLGIVILVRITNLLQTGIVIHLKAQYNPIYIYIYIYIYSALL
jgi:hypothetical protein